MSKNKYNLYTFQTNKMFDIEKLANSNPDLFNELCDKYKVKNNEAVFAFIYKKEEVNESVKVDEPTEDIKPTVTDTIIEVVEKVTDHLTIFENELRKGTGFQEGKFRVYHQYKTYGTKDFDKFLSNEYGIGGWSGPGLPSVFFDSKGCKINFRDGSKEQFFNWKSIAAQIKKLIDNGSYLTNEELETYSQNPTKYVPIRNRGADDEEVDDLPDEAYECDDEAVEVTVHEATGVSVGTGDIEGEVIKYIAGEIDKKLLKTLEGVLAYFTANGYANGSEYSNKMFCLVVETEEFEYLYNGRISRARHRLLKLNDYYFVVEGHMDGMFNAPYLTDKRVLSEVEYKYIPRQKTPLYPENFAPLFNVGENIKEWSILHILLVKDHDNLVGYKYECINRDAEEKVFTEDELCDLEVE